MRKTSSSPGFLACAGMGLFAQNLDKANDFLKAGKLPDAKSEIDKVLAVDKNQKIAGAWYQQLKIYNAHRCGSVVCSILVRGTRRSRLSKEIMDDNKLVQLRDGWVQAHHRLYQGLFRLAPMIITPLV